MSKEIVIKSVDSTKRFGGLTAVNKLNIEVTKGSIHSLIGPNGSGKTTYLNMLSRIYDFTEGEIYIKDRPISKIKPHKVAELGVGRTFQNIRLFNSLTVLENVLIGCHCRGGSNLWDVIKRSRKLRDEEAEFYENAVRSLEFVGLDVPHDRISKQLSYGQQRLLEIARALANSPEILLLDEPAAGMNLAEKEELVKLIRRIRDELGVTVFLIEHSMNIVMNISEIITVINFGKKIAEGTAEEVQENVEVQEAYLGKSGQVVAKNA
jgi:branched-chain amino acid transport system ATP-binding protein